jgi:hypothetical protein
MRQLIEQLRVLMGGSGGAANAEARLDASEARLDSFERAMQIQGVLNETVDAQIKLVYSLLEQVQKRLQLAIIALVAVATIAAFALAAALLR